MEKGNKIKGIATVISVLLIVGVALWREEARHKNKSRQNKRPRPKQRPPRSCKHKPQTISLRRSPQTQTADNLTPPSPTPHNCKTTPFSRNLAPTTQNHPHNMKEETHKAGFIHLIGNPNAGKSTLFNNLIDYPLSIITHKPQTTRHNIVGIAQKGNNQAVYIDTPGYLSPQNQLQKTMKRYVNIALTESDLILFVADIRTSPIDHTIHHLYHKKPPHIPHLLLLNKRDLLTPEAQEQQCQHWKAHIPIRTIITITARNKHEVTPLAQYISTNLPVHPPYYDPENLSDRPQRFFVTEIIRKAILERYQQEIPYSVEFQVENFQEKEHLTHIQATIYTERKSQKAILIGKKGAALKALGQQARQELEAFLQKKVFLDLHIKVVPKWREKTHRLNQWGYH